jgi:enterochelin esterase family protein
MICGAAPSPRAAAHPAVVMNESLHRFRSVELGNQRSVWLREPEGPPAHLAVFLDGEDYREQMRAPALLEDLARDGEIGPVLAVFVSHHSPGARWIELACNPRHARFLDEELLPWLEALRPAVRGCHERVIVGASYGGLAAAHAALAAPRRFTRVIAQSGSFWWNDCWLMRHLAELQAAPPATRFLLTVGAKETQPFLRHRPDVVQTISQVEAAERLHAVLQQRGAPSDLVMTKDGRHDFASWRRALPAALKQALPVLSAAS